MSTENEKTYFGNYTLEKIYDLVGRNDYTSTITFRSNSQSEKLYGNKLTIVFLYTQQEREGLENNIKKGAKANMNSNRYRPHFCLLPSKGRERQKPGSKPQALPSLQGEGSGVGSVTLAI
jgi:hypothetical protein